MSSDFKIATTESFDKSVFKLSKKYSSLKADLLELRSMLLANPQSGIPLGKECYKIRLKITSKNTGKSGGGRVITYVRIQAQQITLLDIYDKSEKENITDKELTDLLKQAGE